jgi:hypothetical protein
MGAASLMARFGLVGSIAPAILVCGAPKAALLARGMPSILATRTDVLSPRMMRIIEDLAGDRHYISFCRQRQNNAAESAFSAIFVCEFACHGGAGCDTQER